eukprot:SAG11_NODE_2122_length_3784_cov_3.569878_2_plen_153_part_00
MEDNGAARSLLGSQVNRINLRYRDLQVRRRRALGEQIDLHRVPCPEIALRRLVQVGQRAEGPDLLWTCALLLMLVCCFRAATVAAFRPGDVRFTRRGMLIVVVRHVKGRPEFATNPAVQQIPSAPPGHPRRQIFEVLHRLLQAATRRPGRFV